MFRIASCCLALLAAVCLAGGAGATEQRAGGPTQSWPQLCQAHLPEWAGRRGPWLNLLASADYREGRQELFLRHDAMDLTWELDRKGRFKAPHMAVFIPVTLAEGATGPYRVEVRFDGRLRWQTSEAPVRTVAHYFADRATGPRKVGEHQELQITSSPTNPFPSLKGVKAFEVVAKGEDGTVWGKFSYELPDWKWMERETRMAFVKANASRQRKLCGPSVVI